MNTTLTAAFRSVHHATRLRGPTLLISGILGRTSCSTCRTYTTTSMTSKTMAASATPAVPRPSASLILVNARNEILLVHRNPRSSTFAGMHVSETYVHSRASYLTSLLRCSRVVISTRSTTIRLKSPRSGKHLKKRGSSWHRRVAAWVSPTPN